MNTMVCDRRSLRSFVIGELDEDDRLSFLFHLDACPRCWEAVYNATKAEHPHFYKAPSKKSRLASELELKALEKPKKIESEEIFEVA